MIAMTQVATNWWRGFNAGSMVGQRRRRSPTIDPASNSRHVLARILRESTGGYLCQDVNNTPGFFIDRIKRFPVYSRFYGSF